MKDFLGKIFSSGENSLRSRENISLEHVQKFESILKRIEERDPKILYLYNVGDGFIRADQSIKDKLVEYQQTITLSGDTFIIPVFRHEIIIVDLWDRNSVFYNLDKQMFPNAKYIIMLSHPCDEDVSTRANDWIWFLPSHSYDSYFVNRSNIQVLDTQQVERLYKLLEGLPSYTATQYGKDNHNLLLQNTTFKQMV